MDEINISKLTVLPVRMVGVKPMNEISCFSTDIQYPEAQVEIKEYRKLKVSNLVPKPPRTGQEDNKWVQAILIVGLITWVAISPASFGFMTAVMLLFTALWTKLFAPEDIRRDTPNFQFWAMILMSLIIGTISVYYLIH